MSVGPLDAGVAAHGHDAAAGPAHVAEQQLQDAGGADDLHAGGVLRPADGVDDGAGALAAGIRAEQLGHLDHLLRRAAAHVGDGLRRVAGEMSSQQLHHAARVLQRRVARRPAGRLLPSHLRAGCRGGWPRP